MLGMSMDHCTVCGELVTLADEPIERLAAVVFVCSGCDRVSCGVTQKEVHSW